MDKSVEWDTCVKISTTDVLKKKELNTTTLLNGFHDLKGKPFLKQY